MPHCSTADSLIVPFADAKMISFYMDTLLVGVTSSRDTHKPYALNPTMEFKKNKKAGPNDSIRSPFELVDEGYISPPLRIIELNKKLTRFAALHSANSKRGRELVVLFYQRKKTGDIITQRYGAVSRDTPAAVTFFHHYIILIWLSSPNEAMPIVQRLTANQLIDAHESAANAAGAKCRPTLKTGGREDESAPLADDPSNVLEVIWKRASSGVPPADVLADVAEGLAESEDFLALEEVDLRTLPALPQLLLLTTSDPELRSRAAAGRGAVAAGGADIVRFAIARSAGADVIRRGGRAGGREVAAAAATNRQDPADERRSGSATLMQDAGADGSLKRQPDAMASRKDCDAQEPEGKVKTTDERRTAGTDWGSRIQQPPPPLRRPENAPEGSNADSPTDA
ncbi:hypothetical protein OUZ56_013566 [Daphnia magna]|uniref:Uncharacterized protein n=1 Tax=Daphnia magna TaxID=35525 RepID=A0ABQ9Z6C3_9CRUS|nr:hypothetical protein OUZ56_013566 [Daphnia magna]